MPPGGLMYFLWEIPAERTYKPCNPQNDSFSLTANHIIPYYLSLLIRQPNMVDLNPVTTYNVNSLSMQSYILPAKCQ
jgi:hypothetical protein